MNIGNCPGCGRLYAKTTAGMCPECYAKEELDEAKVAEYVRDNPNSSVEEIRDAIDVKEKTIFRMIKNGRFVSDAQITYPCQKCHAPIHQGRLCGNCNSDFIKQVKESELKHAAERAAAHREPAPSGGKQSKGMYTKDM